MAEIISSRYAGSLFDVAVEQNCLDAIFDELGSVNEIFSQHGDLLKVLKTPTIACNEKLQIADNIFSKSFSPYIVNFIKILIEKSRLDEIFEIRDEFRKLYYAEKNIEEIQVITAIEISDALKSKLVAKLEKITGKKIIAVYKVDSKILGGIVLKIRNEEIDSSVRTKIEALKNSIESVIA